MNDFAAAAMMRLIRIAAARQHWAMPEVPPRDARVPLAQKRALLEELLADHGPVGLFEIGQALDDAPDEPVLTALKAACDPIDLIERWQRLERFVHSRHRTIVHQLAERRLLLEHASLVPHAPPTAAENLVVFGLLTALLDRLSGSPVGVRFAAQRQWRPRSGAWPRLLPAQTGVLEVCWPAGMRCSPPVARSRSDDILALARGVLAEDSGRSWRLSLLAERIGQSSRTLQRQLLAKGASFSSLLMDVRLAEAARLLTHTSRPLAEIGYACGFADQAHFTRELRRHAALTPLEYRRQFTVMPGPMDDT